MLGLRRYETRWTWLHKMRRAIVRRGRDPLRGRALQGRHLGTNALIVVAAQEQGKGIGRIRMRRIPDALSSDTTRWTRGISSDGDPGAEETLLPSGAAGGSREAGALRKDRSPETKAQQNQYRSYLSQQSAHQVGKHAVKG